VSWQNCTLGDVVKLQRGHDLPERLRVDGPIPIVSSSGITGRHNVAKAEPPGVVTGRYGTIGEVFFLEEPYWPLNTALYVVDFKSNNPRFAAYLLRNTLKNYQSEKAAVPGVDRNVLHLLKVRAPDRQLQERIVSILSGYDDLIENNRRRIALLDEAAQMLYREWFVRFRFPGYEHVNIIDGIPEKWEVKPTVATCSTYDDGDWLVTKDQGGPDYRIIQISNIGNNCFIETGNDRYITEETLRRLNCHEVLPGDIVVSRMPRPIGRGWMVSDMPFRMVTAVDVTIVRPDQKQILPYYLLHHINSDQNIARCEANATGTTRPRISRKRMGGLPILLPPVSLQRQFSDFAENAHRLRTNLFGQNQKLAQARDILLPRLLNGEIAV
jgi:type I restriction enzyme S subunit